MNSINLEIVFMQVQKYFADSFDVPKIRFTPDCLEMIDSGMTVRAAYNPARTSIILEAQACNAPILHIDLSQHAPNAKPTLDAFFSTCRESLASMPWKLMVKEAKDILVNKMGNARQKVSSMDMSEGQNNLIVFLANDYSVTLKSVSGTASYKIEVLPAGYCVFLAERRFDNTKQFAKDFKELVQKGLVIKQ